MTRKSQNSASAGRYAYEGLERAIHEKARLGILTSLVARPQGLAFTDLKSLCALTDGNLNRHLDVLREAGLVEIEKDQSAGRAATICRLTPQGKKRFLEYLAELQRVVADAASAGQPTATAQSARRGWKPGLQT